VIILGKIEVTSLVFGYSARANILERAFMKLIPFLIGASSMTILLKLVSKIFNSKARF
jgi:hypothetical protein